MATLFIVPVQLISIFLDWNYMPMPVRIVGIYERKRKKLFCQYDIILTIRKNMINC